jgi:maltooligosyltrehalose trehalohydrolase
LFQGQEFSASSPFLFFADHEPELAQVVREARAAEMSRFAVQMGTRDDEPFEDPADRRTFERSKLDHGQRTRNVEVWRLHQDLLRLRREDPVFSAQRADRIQGAVLDAQAFALRYFGDDGDDRLVIVNLGDERAWSPPSEPLLAPSAGRSWQLLWSSEDARYGGRGAAPIDPANWFLPQAALVLAARPA